MKATPDQIPDHLKRLNPGIFGEPTTYETRQAEYAKGQEVKFQADAEAFLRYKGFAPRTPQWLGKGRPESGWYVHLHNTEGNPLLLDILVMPHNGGWFELELKASGGKLRKAQQQIIEQSERCHECRTMDEVKQLVNDYLGGSGA